jgi:hypothetical protein
VKTTTKRSVSGRNVSSKKPVYVSCSIALLLGAAVGNEAWAFEVETGNPDVSVRWDNTIRYNAGWRMEGRNDDFDKSPFYDDTEHKFDKGDMVTNRLDLISELDVAWKQKHGFRVSAAGWYDHAYQDSAEPNPNLVGSGNYTNNHYNGFANRYIAGPSGEILDAFAFTGFQVGSVGVNVKAGQHNVYWGESLFTLGNSIAYSQGPVDTIKAATSPGAEAKELFLPLKQISTDVQLTDELSFGAQYLMDWKPFRLVPGGTYFSNADGARSDLGSPAAIFKIPNGDDIEPDKHGDFGLNLRWSPYWLEGTAGVYYRKFGEKLPWSFTQVGIVQVAPGRFAGIPNAIRYNYARDTELYGLSLTKNLGTVSVAGEVSYRKNTALNSVAGYTVISSGDASYSQAEGARGNSYHALINGIYLLPRTALWEGGTLQAELTYNKLDKITENDARFNGRGHGCVTAYSKNCADDHSVGTQVGFTPEWPQLFPGWDVSMPVTWAYGIEGNSPTLGGTSEGAYNYSVGISGKWMNLHNFTLKWIDSHADYKNNPARGYVTSDYTNGAAVQNDHGWLSFTYKTTF